MSKKSNNDYRAKTNYIDDFFLTGEKEYEEKELYEQIRISGIVRDSIVDGPGLRIAVFTQGCVHNCKGCHNPHTHDINGGKLVSIKEIIDIIDSTPLIDGLTITGGEPFLQAEKLALLAKKVKSKGLSVLTFTGYTWEELIDNEKFSTLLEQSDFIIDGKYEEKLGSLNLNFKGSKNQRVIDVKKSKSIEKIVEIEKF